MSAKKTPEELRAKNRERQRKWRANNLTQAQLKERNASRIRRGTMEPMPAPEPNAEPNAEPNSDNFAPNDVTGYGELSYEPFGPGVDMPYEERAPANRAQPHQPPVARRGYEATPRALRDAKRLPLFLQPKKVDRPPEETPNETNTYRNLEELKQRKAAGKLGRADGPGIEVPLEL
jgi:hypothetical protein